MRALVLSLLPTLLAAQAIPDRPEKTAAPTLVFEAPRPSDARVTLKNGIPVYLVSDPTALPMVSLRVQIRGGAYLDPAGKEGLTAAWASQLRQGGTRTLGADQLDARLDFLAAEMMSGNGEAACMVTLNLMEKDLPEGIGLIQGVLTQPAFAQERLDLWRRNTLRGIEQLNDDPASIERYQLQLVTKGPDHPASRWPTPEALKGIGREDLLAHHARMLHPENLIVSVGGRFDKAAVLKRLNETLGTLKAAPTAKRNPPPPAPTHVAKPGIYVVHKANPQGRVTFALPGLKETDPDWVPVQVMNFILGGDFTSRLTYLIRTQEGLSYTVNSRFTPGAWFPGDFRAIFQTKGRSVAYGVRLAAGELKRLQSEPVPGSELDKAKGALINGFPARFSSPEAVAATFGQAHLTSLPEDTLTRFRERVKAVTAADIQRVAKQYLPLEKLVVLVVGDRETLEMGDTKDHPGKLSETLPLPVTQLPLWDPATRRPVNP